MLFYQLRISGRLDEEGAAYDPGALDPREITTLRAYCVKGGLPEPITLDAFREEIFLGKGYDCVRTLTAIPATVRSVRT